ncbi:MAG: aspartate kinase [Clostridiales bacterium]|jgi:aspartate kinase|nr:aspartate kinase [Clostridiales bacterium]
MKVLKFGGTSMANADAVKRAADIAAADPDNKFVVVSAPGKRDPADVKVTDLLYACYNEKLKTGACGKSFAAVEKRFNDIIAGLNLRLDISGRLERIKREIDAGAGKDYAASRGEYLCAVLVAAYLDREFIDAADLIKFDARGNFCDELTNAAAAKILAKSDGAVIPGFYGVKPDGAVKTFTRGGSDVTGSIIARAVRAEVYENWTDVDGFLVCDPRIVNDAKLIPMLTYKELRELSYMGANVLHSDCIFPVRKSDIPIRIRNTFNPGAEGTLIVPTKKFLSGEFGRPDSVITGIAGRKDFAAIHIEKSLMNNELGFARRVLSVLERRNISVEHMPSGIDTLSPVVDGADIDPEVLRLAAAEIRSECGADNVETVEGLALIAVVGHGMSRKRGTAARVFAALSAAGINIRMIDQGSSELNLIVAVENGDYENAVKSLYRAFF